MNEKLQMNSLPKGFLCSGVSAGIKPNGDLDMALIYSEVLANAAGVFTTNQVCAAPVKLCRKHLTNSKAKAIIINSGIANACTGELGMESASLMAQETANHLKCSHDDILVCSTGKIGPQLPMDNIFDGIHSLIGSASADQIESTTQAIMTTDTKPKLISRSIEWNDKIISLTGIAKGAGMIEPNMATMLAFIITDANVDPMLLNSILKLSVNESFNRITVDGDQSTNDSVLILANGASGIVVEKSEKELYSKFINAVNEICFELAMMIVKDGEGSDRFVTVSVEGAKSFDDADQAARSVANSLLNKTAWAGTYPDWGRIMDAIGYSRAKVDEEKVNIFYGETQAVKSGVQADTSFEELVNAVSVENLSIRINLGLGVDKATVYTCNCTEAYVQINV